MFDLNQPHSLWCVCCDQRRKLYPAPGKRGTMMCRQCGTEVNLWQAMKNLAANRRKVRVKKQKAMGTYKPQAQVKQEREERRREIDKKYVWWIHGWRCIVPGCLSPWPVHAHHVDRRSQGGSDRSCIPLCPRHHIQDLHGRFGPALAQKEWQVDFDQITDALNQNYNIGKFGPYHHQLDAFDDDEPYEAS